MDASKTKFCRSCNSPVPPEQYAKFRCKACEAKAKQGKGRWKFDQYGNVISKGQKKTGVAAPASKTK